MKRKKLTGLTLLFASALVSTAVGGALLDSDITASAAAETFALSDVFATSSTEIKADGDNKVTAFEMSDEGNVTLKRDLAFQWYEAGNKKNFALKFAFKDTNFETVTFAMDSKSAWATEDDKATNKIVFTKTDVKVNGGNAVAFTATAGAQGMQHVPHLKGAIFGRKIRESAGADHAPRCLFHHGEIEKVSHLIPLLQISDVSLRVGEIGMGRPKKIAGHVFPCAVIKHFSGIGDENAAKE